MRAVREEEIAWAGGSEGGWMDEWKIRFGIRNPKCVDRPTGPVRLERKNCSGMLCVREKSESESGRMLVGTRYARVRVR